MNPAVRRQLCRVLLHALAAVVGVGSALFIKSRFSESEDAYPQNRELKRETARDSLRGNDLVDAFISNLAPQHKDSKDHPATKAQQRFRELFKTLESSSDPESTFKTMLAELDMKGPIAHSNQTAEELEALTMLAVRFSQWLEADPRGALEAMAALNSENGNHMKALFIMPILDELCQKQGLRNAMAWITEIKPSDVAVQHLGIYLGKEGNLDDLRWYLAEHADFPSAPWAEALQASIGAFWPVDKRDELISELSGDGKLRAMISLAERMKGPEGVEWIRDLAEQGQLDASELKSLSEGYELRSLILQVDAPLEDRVAFLKEFGLAPEEVTHAFKAQQIVHRDISPALNGHDAEDWLYWFRSGEVSGAEVYDAILERIPDPGSEIDEFRSQMFRHLAESDIDRAMDVLDGMAPQDQDWQRAYAARWWFGGVDPNKFYRLTSEIADHGDPGMQKFLSECWKGKSGQNLERFGDGYVEWVSELPAGQHRIWALEGLEQASRGKHPDIHRQVSNLLTETR